MKIKHNYGLLLVDITLTFKGRSEVIKNMVVDTEETKTLIFKNMVEELGLRVELQEKLLLIWGGKENAFKKQVDQIQYL
ncbi:hypothetical protein PU629_18640 [Pullulanibacillus sp. KACC 23026]|uniref:hypothetical protein n=1 Tax=Pullulanibacillus sp. KACC 23026 TaxID=3028315 RepID=UPI0023B0555D|nr:hypothetical protein [Pullulanibacillus sp. KACC 23026]WEG12113.1 hypothetical protein PU629_18640 [Pullulanibacillus sp. KACC 23026]